MAITLTIFSFAVASAGVAPQNETTQVRSARAGDVYRGVIVLRNTSSELAEVKLYQTDYSFTADGSTNFGEPGSHARSNAPWLRLNQEQVSVGAGRFSRVEYEVRVPNDARLTGTYWSAIMVEQLGDAESGVRANNQVQLRQSIRYAIQVISEVGDSGKGSIAFDNARLVNDKDRRWFTVDLMNTGERWLRTNVWLELHDSNGRLTGRFEGAKLRTFPNTSVRDRIDLSGIPPGKYLALLVADGGRNDLFGTQLELNIR